MTSCPLLHRVDRAIQASPYALRRRVYLESVSGQVILRGKVDSYFQKQMIQESLRGIDGVHQINNQLEVEADSPLLLVDRA